MFAVIEIYKDKADKWRWRGKNKSGRKVAESGRGYTYPRSLKKALYDICADTTHESEVKILTKSRAQWPERF